LQIVQNEEKNHILKSSENKMIIEKYDQLHVSGHTKGMSEE